MESPVQSSVILRTSKFLLLVFVLYILGNVIIAAISALGRKLISYDLFSDTLMLYCASALIISALAILVPSLFYLHRNTSIAPKAEPITFKVVILSFFAGIGGIFVSASINLLIILISGGMNASDAALPMPDIGGYRLPIALLSIALLPAISEELFFRRILLCGYSRLGIIPSIAISAALFALFHSNPLGIPVYFVLGCIFGFMAVKANSPVPSIIAHTVNNAAAVLLSAVKTPRAAAQSGIAFQFDSHDALASLVYPISCILLMGIGLIILIPCLYGFGRIAHKEAKSAHCSGSAGIGKEGKGALFAPLLNLPFICTVFLLIMLNVLSVILE